MTDTRPATDEERSRIPLRTISDARVAPASSEPSWMIGIDPTGCCTEPDVPCLHLLALTTPAPIDPLGPLLDTILQTGPSGRLVARWDPMDRAVIRVLESRGFVSTGRLPYFEMGGGLVEYVTGYGDATGSWLDLATRPEP